MPEPISGRGLEAPPQEFPYRRRGGGTPMLNRCPGNAPGRRMEDRSMAVAFKHGHLAFPAQAGMLGGAS